MLRSRVQMALIALAAAGVPAGVLPVAAQSVYDAGSFTIELPSGIRLARTNVVERPSGLSETFTAFEPDHGIVVMVYHNWVTGVPSDPALRSMGAVQQIIRDTARLRAALGSSRDTSQAMARELWRALNDTSLAVRRGMVRDTRTIFAAGSRFVKLGDEMREIVTDKRVTLRSPATLHVDAGPALVGTADFSFVRRGPAEFWFVVYAVQRPTAESGAAAERMLDSFHITGAPTSLPDTPP